MPMHGTVDRTIAEALADSQERLARARRLAQLVQTGQLDPSALTVDAWEQLLNSLSQMMGANPNADWSSALNRYVRPLLGANVPAQLQGRAARILASRSAYDRADPTVLAWLQSPSIAGPMFQQKANVLDYLMQVAPNDPNVAATYTLFMTRYAPKGTLTSAAFGPTGAAQLIDLYRRAMPLMGENPLWSQAPKLTVPEGASGLPLVWRELARELAQREIAQRGLAVTPRGIEFNPALAVSQAFGLAPAAYEQSGWEAIQNQFEALNRALSRVTEQAQTPRATTPAPTAAPTQEPAPSGQTRGRSLANRFVQVVRDFVLDNILRRSLQTDEETEAVFQLLKPVLEEKFADRMELRRILESIAPDELIRQFGSPALYRRVWQWVLTGQ